MPDVKVRFPSISVFFFKSICPDCFNRIYSVLVVLFKELKTTSPKLFVASVKVVDIEPINFVEPERLLPNNISQFLPLDIPLTELSCPNNDKIVAVLFVGATSNNC